MTINISFILVALSLQLFFSFYLIKKIDGVSTQSLQRAFLSILQICSIYLIISFLCHLSNLFYLLFVIIFFCHLATYRYKGKYKLSLNPSVYLKNKNLLLNKQSIDVMLTMLGLKGLIAYLVLALTPLIFPLELNLHWLSLLASLMFIFVFTKSSFMNYEYLTKYFFEAKYGKQKAYSKFFKNDLVLKKSSKLRIKPVKLKENEEYDKKNIIILLVESLSSHVIDLKEEGKDVMPFLNSLVKEHGHIKKSICSGSETTKGLFSILHSMPCSLDVPIYSELSHINFYGLNYYLSLLGYESSYFQAYKDLSYGNKDKFLSTQKFDNVLSAEDIEKSREGEAFGWGMRDDIFYERFFKFLNKRNKDKPFFSTLLTVSSHMWFNHLPEKEKKIYPKSSGKEIYKNYINSMNFSDRCLEVFFKELERSGFAENTLVFITGDHSFPLEKELKFNNMLSVSEQAFSSPILLWGKEKKYSLSSSNKRSQLDIAPTILDLIGVKKEIPYFFGESLLRKTKKAAYSVQPHNGPSLAIYKDNIRKEVNFSDDDIELNDELADFLAHQYNLENDKYNENY